MVTENEIREWFLAESKAGNSEILVELSLYLDNIIEKMGCISDPHCPYHKQCREKEYCVKEYGF